MPEQTEEDATSCPESHEYPENAPAETFVKASRHTPTQESEGQVVEPQAAPLTDSGVQAADGRSTDPITGQSGSYSPASIEKSVAALDGLDALSLDEHVEHFEAVHAQLTAALSSIDKV